MNIPRILFPIALCLILIACSGKGVKPEAKKPAPPTASTGIPTTPSAPAAAPPIASAPEKGSGGYYLDDGPHDNPPTKLDEIPDAVPRVEQLASRSNSPYTVFGKRYVPMQGYVPYKQSGIASWYGKRFHGKKTSNGEIYDMYSMTGAHTTLPLPSYVRVTNPGNGRSVVIRINDRGPFHSNRLIDLSYAAAHKLGLISKGSGKVEVEAIDSRQESGFQATAITPAQNPPAITNVNVAEAASPSSPVAPAASTPVTKAPLGSYVQVGAFKYENNAEGLRQKLIRQNLANDGASGNVSVASWYNDGIYRVRLGPYSTHESATEAAAKIKQVLGAKAIVINQD